MTPYRAEDSYRVRMTKAAAKATKATRLDPKAVAIATLTEMVLALEKRVRELERQREVAA